jgi:hypothetical protein
MVRFLIVEGRKDGSAEKRNGIGLLPCWLMSLRSEPQFRASAIKSMVCLLTGIAAAPESQAVPGRRVAVVWFGVGAVT